MLTTRRALIGAYQMVVQRIGHAYAHSLEPQGLRDVVTNVLAIVLPSHGFDQDGLHPVGGSAMIHDSCTRFPFQGEVADLLAQHMMILPRCRRHVGIGETTLV